MNGYLILFFVVLAMVVAVLLIIRDAITVDGAKAKAAMQHVGARIRALFRRGP